MNQRRRVVDGKDDGRGAPGDWLVATEAISRAARPGEKIKKKRASQPLFLSRAAFLSPERKAIAHSGKLIREVRFYLHLSHEARESSTRADEGAL